MTARACRPTRTATSLLGAFADLEIFCRDHKVDLLIVALPLHAEDRILQILGKLWVLPVDVRISALGSKLTLRDRAYNYIGDVPFLPVFDKPMSDWDIAIKAIFDARRGCVADCPALAGPCPAGARRQALLAGARSLFVQKRYGFNNEQLRRVQVPLHVCGPLRRRRGASW